MLQKSPFREIHTSQLNAQHAGCLEEQQYRTVLRTLQPLNMFYPTITFIAVWSLFASTALADDSISASAYTTSTGSFHTVTFFNKPQHGAQPGSTSYPELVVGPTTKTWYTDWAVSTTA